MTTASEVTEKFGFTIGDQVSCQYYMAHPGGIGTVVGFYPGSTGWVGVDFGYRVLDKDGIPRGHNLHGKANKETGYYFPPHLLTIVNSAIILGDDDSDCV